MTRDERQRIAEGEVHVWWLDPLALSAARLAAYRAVMTDEERAREQRMAFPHLRRDLVATRGLARGVLARYAGVAPSDLRFSHNPYGRPHIIAPAAAIGLHFNLSNTTGLIACGLGPTYAIGVDVESVERAIDLDGLAEVSFSPDECAAMRRLPPARRRERFFVLWTLKEAYIKARGLGLQLPLDQFSFHLDEPDGEIRISFGPAIADDPSRWRFWLRCPRAGHQLAVAAEAGVGALRLFELPLAAGGLDPV